MEPQLNNREAGQKPFHEKKEVYARSKYVLSNSINAEGWNIRMIKHRQAGLGKTAAGIWKL
ncbi:DUF1524 domain-containing protein [bacterium]|nr:DUF1524 domain-containing protein [bacterium]